LVPERSIDLARNLWSQMSHTRFRQTLQPKEFFVRSHKYLPHFVIGMLLLALLVCFAPSLRASLAQSNDADAIRSLIQKLFDSYQQKDLDRLISFWSQKSPFLAENKKALQKEFAAYKKIVVKGFDIRRMKADVDRATLRVVVDMALTSAHMLKAGDKAEKKNRTVELVNDGGIWKVWKFISAEEELAAAIVAAKTEEERKALMEKEPELITSDLAFALIGRNYPPNVSQRSYQRALAINQLVDKLFEHTGDQRVKAQVLINAGVIHGGIGTPEKSPELALDCFRQSLKIGEEFGFKDVIAISLINSAITYGDVLGEYSQASEYYQRGLKAAEEWGDHQSVINALNNLANLYHIKANYAKAMELRLRSLKLSESRLDSGADWRLLALVLTNIGNAFALQSNFEQALSYSQRGLEAAEKAIKLGVGSARTSKANALAIIGQIYLRQGNHSSAIDYYQKSLAVVEESGNMWMGPKDSFISTVKVSIGNAMVEQNDILQAIANYQEAFQLAEKSGQKTRLAHPLERLSFMYLRQGDYGKALAFAERAVNAAEQTGQSHYAYAALVSAAQAYQKLGEIEKARQTLARAIDLTEQLRQLLAGTELDRQRSYEPFVIPYQAMIDLEVDQKRFTEAFSYAQLTKGRTLLELLQIGRLDVTKPISPADRKEEQQLSRKIISLNRQLTGEKLKSQPDEKRLSEFEGQLKKARLEFEAFQTTLYASHPELKVQRGEIRPISFDDTADLIPDTKTALLDFSVTSENAHIFVLTRDGSARPALNTYTIKIRRKSLAEKVERYRRRMENRDYDFQALSKELYELLIKPAEKQLQGRTNLIISPDNVLWDLPFQALLSPELCYLIEDAAISYVPSLSVLREMQLAGTKEQAPAKASILALGDPALGTRSKELVKYVKMDAELVPLPEAADQVRALGRLYGPKLSQVFTGSAAREELVKEQSARYRILHLATHGILNDVSPMYSHVLLSQTPGKSDEDGLLEAWEMMNLDLNADLVVLAGCETARGRVGTGEGMIGMTWALFAAGCPRTVVSQWKVEASSTTALMVEFHKRFKTRYGGTRSAISTAEAMRQAALKVMKNPEYVHPFYWGGFVVVGDGN
jgi:CHAT domain-containing protein